MSSFQSHFISHQQSKGTVTCPSLALGPGCLIPYKAATSPPPFQGPSPCLSVGCRRTCFSTQLSTFHLQVCGFEPHLWAIPQSMLQSSFSVLRPTGMSAGHWWRCLVTLPNHDLSPCDGGTSSSPLLPSQTKPTLCPGCAGHSSPCPEIHVRHSMASSVLTLTSENA